MVPGNHTPPARETPGRHRMVAILAQDLMGGPGTALWRLRGGGATTFLEEVVRNKEQGQGKGEDRREVLGRGEEEVTGTLEDRREDREDLEDRVGWLEGDLKETIRAKEDQERSRIRTMARTVTEDKARHQDRNQAKPQDRQ